jgi:hypothetical protein
LIYVAGTEAALEGNKDGEIAADEEEGKNAYPNTNEGLVLLAKAPSGYVVEIRVDEGRPKSFKVQYIPIYYVLFV